VISVRDVLATHCVIGRLAWSDLIGGVDPGC